MYIWQNKLFLPNLLYITECFFLNSFFFCHISEEKKEKPLKAKNVVKYLQGKNLTI